MIFWISEFSAELRAQLNELHPTIHHATSTINVRGNTVVDRLWDVNFRVRRGVRAGAAAALSLAQLHQDVPLSTTLPLDIIGDHVLTEFNNLVEEFADRADTVAEIIPAGEVIGKVFDEPNY